MTKIIRQDLNVIYLMKFYLSSLQYSNLYGGGLRLISKHVLSRYDCESEYIQYSPFGVIHADQNLANNSPAGDTLTFTKDRKLYSSIFEVKSHNVKLPISVLFKSHHVENEQIDWGQNHADSKSGKASILTFIELNFFEKAEGIKRAEQYSLRIPQSFITGCAQPNKAKIIEENGSNNFILEFTGGAEDNQYITRIGVVWHTQLNGKTTYQAAWSRTMSCKAPEVRWKYCVYHLWKS